MHFDAAILDGSDQANNPSSGQSVSTWGDEVDKLQIMMLVNQMLNTSLHSMLVVMTSM